MRLEGTGSIDDLQQQYERIRNSSLKFVVATLLALLLVAASVMDFRASESAMPEQSWSSHDSNLLTGRGLQTDAEDDCERKKSEGERNEERARRHNQSKIE